MKSQTIGVEIELTGLTRNAVAKVLEKYFGTTKLYVGGAYDTYEVEDGEQRVWKVMRDSSVTPQKKHEGEINSARDEYKVELVTPILNYGDIETLQEVVRVIRKAGGFVNESTGMHIHIGANDFTAQAACNLFNAVASKEELLYKALKVHESRKHYCGKANRRVLREISEKKPQTLKQLAAIWYNEPERRATRNHPHYHESRYTICNLHALFTKGTVEFRIFNSTLHAGEVKAAIQFCLALTHQAKTTRKATCRPTITDNPKYTMRCWLLRLGMNGDEFKTARLHLLKHLEGNAAWRNARTA